MTMKKMLNSKDLPGTIYERNGRYHWKVKLPNSDKRQSYPLIPVGAQFATKDYAVAVKVAEYIWQEAIRKSDPDSSYNGTISDLVARYNSFAKEYYKNSKEPANIEIAVRHLTEFCPTMLVEDFSLRTLKELRESMTEMTVERNGEPRPRLCRKVINQRINIIRRMFLWAVNEELAPVHVYESLRCLIGLKQGRSKAVDHEPVTSVSQYFVNLVADHASPIIADMMRIQMLTGMRSGELVLLKPCYIKMAGHVWEYEPPTHKTKHLGKKRIIPIGPKAQVVLKKYLFKVDDYCFKPEEGMANNQGRLPIELTDHYTTGTYGRAVQRALRRAQKAAEKENRPPIPDFSPHNLRHTAATLARAEMGLEAAQVMLGHSSADVTEIYAERNLALAKRLAEKIG